MKRKYCVQLLLPDGSEYCTFELTEKMIRELEIIAAIEEISFEEAIRLALSMGASVLSDVKAEITAGMLNQGAEGGQV